MNRITERSTKNLLAIVSISIFSAILIAPSTIAAPHPIDTHKELGEFGENVEVVLSTHTPDHPAKITLCHKEKNTITVSPDALAAHLAHGDRLGPC